MLWIVKVSFIALYKNRRLYHVPKENSALSSAAHLALIESSGCPRYQRYLRFGTLHFSICVSVYTNMHKDLKKGPGARACLFLSLLFAFFQLYNTDL